MTDSFKARGTLVSGATSYQIWQLSALGRERVARLPYALKILLENLLRFEDGVNVTRADIEALLNWDPKAAPSHEISFTPARVIMQDFTGVPAVVDLAAMREAMVRLGGDPDEINPLAPAELVVDHSVQVDSYGSAQSLAENNRIEFERNGERYAFLRWGQSAFRNFKVVPPNTGIVHQVNLEYLGRVVFEQQAGAERQAYPDTVVGTDSHTTMINGLGVLGWGVGGIEAEAAMLGQPVTMLIPQVVGLPAQGRAARRRDCDRSGADRDRDAAQEGCRRQVRRVLRRRAREPAAGRPRDHQQHVAGVRQHLRDLPDRRGDAALPARFPAARRSRCGWSRTTRAPRACGAPMAHAAADYTAVLELDLASVEPSLAGPSRPQDRVPLRSAQSTYRTHHARLAAERRTRQPAATGSVPVVLDGRSFELRDGAVLIAAITSCTNTSNPYVLVAAGLLARNAQRRGLAARPWVKTSLAPGSRVVTEYLQQAGLLEPLASVGFNLVGYGCTTCIGNSGPLKPESVGGGQGR